MNITVVVADNDSGFQIGLVGVLRSNRISNVVECKILDEVVEALESDPSAIVLASTPILNGLIGPAQPLGHRTVLITNSNELLDPELTQCVQGIIYRTATTNHILDCISKVRSGTRWIHPLDEAEDYEVSHLVYGRLTKKERLILALINQGLENKAIAERLHTTPQVIRNCNRDIYEKVGVSTRVEIAFFLSGHPTLVNVLNHLAVASERATLKPKPLQLRLLENPQSEGQSALDRLRLGLV